MKKGLRWMAVMIAVAGLLAGCAKEAGVDAAGTSVMETPAATTESEPEIVIHSERETEDAGRMGRGIITCRKNGRKRTA